MRRRRKEVYQTVKQTIMIFVSRISQMHGQVMAKDKLRVGLPSTTAHETTLLDQNAVDALASFIVQIV